MAATLTITKPDDWHIHVRDGKLLSTVVPYTTAQFGRGLIMPNLSPPITGVDQAEKYRKEILNALPPGSNFDPKMSLYLTNDTSIDDVKRAAECQDVLGFKLYPAGATTNSADGVTRIIDMMPVFESMAEQRVVLQIHGEVTDPHVDIFDREAVFIDQILLPLHQEIPELGIVLEHVTTSQGVDFVKGTNHFVAATITPQHLMYNRNELFRGGIRPHNYCLPVLKREPHRQAVLEAAVSGDPSFFLGTDSAPHTRNTKESACGCAGIFSAPAAIEIYAEIFEGMEALEKLEGFASHYGADFYKLDRNSEKISLVKKPQNIPESIVINNSSSNDELVPFLAGDSLSWTLDS